ncbi:MAG TPA: Crp/Fnr family transcriptional regulator [Gemmatimonadaceae bacterium]|nr:Crp/Fnr family transcriptional regulator [Gemmatimonadaceae bacterium]
MRDTARLSQNQRESIATYGARTTWPAGFTVYERGSPASGLFIVLKGQVVLRNSVGTGRSFVPWVATPGETFGSEGLEPKGRYVTSARAEEESETLHLSAPSFSALMREQPAHALDLVRQLTSERTALLEKFCQHATLTVEQRLIASLIRMARSRVLDGEPATGTAVPRRLLGELVGATRESISLVLGRLSSEGLVQRTGNGLVITDLERLETKLSAPARSVGLDVFDERVATDQALR